VDRSTAPVAPRPERSAHRAVPRRALLVARETVQDMAGVDTPVRRAQEGVRMQVQINTDRNIDGDETMIDHAEGVVRSVLARFSARITRVEVHLSDQNSDKKFGTHDVRCMMEARVAGLKPTAVRHDAATPQEAVEGAAGKMQRSLETTLGRLANR